MFVSADSDSLFSVVSDDHIDYRKMLASLNFVAISQVLKHVFVWNQLRDTLTKVLGRDIRSNAALLRQLARGQLWRIIDGVSTFEIVPKL